MTQSVYVPVPETVSVPRHNIYRYMINKFIHEFYPSVYFKSWKWQTATEKQIIVNGVSQSQCCSRRRCQWSRRECQQVPSTQDSPTDCRERQSWFRKHCRYFPTTLNTLVGRCTCPEDFFFSPWGKRIEKKNEAMKRLLLILLPHSISRHSAVTSSPSEIRTSLFSISILISRYNHFQEKRFMDINHSYP